VSRLRYTISVVRFGCGGHWRVFLIPMLARYHSNEEHCEEHFEKARCRFSLNFFPRFFRASCINLFPTHGSHMFRALSFFTMTNISILMSGWNKRHGHLLFCVLWFMAYTACGASDGHGLLDCGGRLKGFRSARASNVMRSSSYPIYSTAVFYAFRSVTARSNCPS
jgi:hypothetical protein